MPDTISILTKTLPVRLTPSEREERGIALARANTTLADWIEESKAEARARKEVQKGYEVDRDRLTDIVRSGEEDRGVECEVVADWATGEATIIRRDTGKIVERRPLTEAEQQMELSFRRAADEPPKPAEPKPKRGRNDGAPRGL